MAKNLKLNIKNTQLAQALNLGKVKEKVAETKARVKEKQVPEEERLDPLAAQNAPPLEEEPRKVKARAKNAPLPKPEVEAEEASPETFSLAPTAEETSELLAQEEERKQRIAKSRSFLTEDISSSPQEETFIEPAPLAEPTPISPLPTPIEKKAEGPSPTEELSPKKPAERTPERRSAPFVKPNYPPRRPFTPRESDTKTGGSSVKLGPTGRHIKDLIKPKPSLPSRTDDTRTAKRTSGVASKEEAKAVETPARSFKKADSSEEESKRPAKAKEFLDLKPLKKQAVKGFDARDRQGLRDGDSEGWRKRRPSKQMRQHEEVAIVRPSSLKIRLPISIKDLAAEMKLKASELISKLFMQGMIVTLNDLLDDETTVQLLGQDFGCEIQIDTTEEARIRVTDKTIQEEIKIAPSEQLVIRAPVVTFMGHVDHGKTSLIDSIRKSNRVASEAGAITQHIGAFCCKTAVGDITILDTPGHEAFSAMRSRGASVTDIVVLVIAGDEGMKQQTLEALNQAKEAKVTIVVALNKCDKPGFNAENVYQQLSQHELLPESWGGETITVNCSAVTGEGIAQLLEMLALQAEVLELKANPSSRARGTVLESELHKGFGPVATVLVQNGTLRLGDGVVFNELYGRIKTMQDEFGQNLTEAGPSTPVAITGLSGLPEAGCEFVVVKSEKEAKDIAAARVEGTKRTSLLKKKVSLENLVQQAAAFQKKTANFILRADVQGSLEALKASLLNIKSDKIEVNVIHAGVGEISESDIELAAASQAIIIGFHSQIESHADSLIKQKGVKVILFDVIYHAIEEVKKLLVELLDKIPEERELGSAVVLATFKASQLGVIAGCMVQEGSIYRNQKVRLIRDNEVIWKGSIASLKRIKEDVKEVKKGLECGILLNGFNDAKADDIIQCYEVHYLTQEL